MSEVFALAVQLALGMATLVVAHPKLGAVLFVAWLWAASIAKRLGVVAGFGGRVLLPLALVVWLWKNRRDVREVILAGAIFAGGALWAWAVRYSPPEIRLRVGLYSVLTVLAAGGVWAFSYLDGRAPTVANFRAARAQSLRQWDAERSVVAATTDGVKIDSVRADGDAVLANVTVAVGQSPGDLETLLMDRLAPTVYRLTGREAVAVSVSRTRTPGRFLVRMSTDHPLRKEVLWRDLPS